MSMIIAYFLLFLFQTNWVHSQDEYCVQLPDQCAKNGNPECRSSTAAPINNFGTSITKSVTVTGRTCQNWSSQTPHGHAWPSIGNHNMCRNPDGGSGPWCYTTDPNKRWELCYDDCTQGEYCIRLPEQCAKTGQSECIDDDRAPLTNHGTYIERNITVSGRECQKWSVQTPHNHRHSTVGDNNMCRNPDGGAAPWCYTTDPSKRWEYCYDTCPIKQSDSELEVTCDKLIHAFFDGMSCIVGSSDKKTHPDAKASCNKLPNGRLAFILTMKELEMIKKQFANGLLVKTYHWIGLEQLDKTEEPDKKWAWVDSNTGESYEIPEQPAFMNGWWENGEPSNSNNKQDVANVRPTGLDDKPATTSRNYLCQYEPDVKQACYVLSKYMKGYSLTNINESDEVNNKVCAKKCIRHPMCRSFSYNTITHHCIIHWTDGTAIGYQSMVHSDYNFYSF